MYACCWESGAELCAERALCTGFMVWLRLTGCMAQVLDLMGEQDSEFSGLSQAMRETYNADIMGKPAPSGTDDDPPHP